MIFILANFSFFKALDLWMAGCMLFVFGALSEFVVVKVLDESYKSCKKSEQRIGGVVANKVSRKKINKKILVYAKKITISHFLQQEHPTLHANWSNNLTKIDVRQMKRNSIVQVCWTNVSFSFLMTCKIFVFFSFSRTLVKRKSFGARSIDYRGSYFQLFFSFSS